MVNNLFPSPPSQKDGDDTVERREPLWMNIPTTSEQDLSKASCFKNVSSTAQQQQKGTHSLCDSLNCIPQKEPYGTDKMEGNRYALTATNKHTLSCRRNMFKME